MAVLAFAIVLLWGAEGAHVTDPRAESVTNPVFPDTRSVEAGRELFAQNCSACHGPIGRGDGALAGQPNPPPVDLTVHVPLHSDGAIWTWITNGIPGTDMPSFREELTDQQRWDLVNFLRTLRGSDR